MRQNSQSQTLVMQYGAILSAILTALIHIYLSFQFAEGPDTIFLLNGIGYLFLVALLYLPVQLFVLYRGTLRWVLMAYAALTIILWIFWGARTTIGYVDKLVEIALILFLWLDNQRNT